MAKVVEKGTLGEYFKKIEEMCEEKGLVPVIMDKMKWGVTIKDSGKKIERGMKITPVLFLHQDGFKNGKADVMALHNFMTIGFFDKESMSKLIHDLQDGKDVGQQTLEKEEGETDGR